MYGCLQPRELWSIDLMMVCSIAAQVLQVNKLQLYVATYIMSQQATSIIVIIVVPHPIQAAHSGVEEAVQETCRESSGVLVVGKLSIPVSHCVT